MPATYVPPVADDELIETSWGNAVSLAVGEVQARFPIRLYAPGAGSVGVTVEGVLTWVTLPAQPVAGYLMVWGSCFVVKTLASSAVSISLRQTSALSGALLAIDTEFSGTTQTTGHPTCSVATAAGVISVVSMTIKVEGGGSGTCYADTTNNRLDALWIPNAP